MNIAFYSRKFAHNYFMCLLGMACLNYFGESHGMWYALIPAFIFGWAKDTLAADEYWFHGNRGK